MHPLVPLSLMLLAFSTSAAPFSSPLYTRTPMTSEKCDDNLGEQIYVATLGYYIDY